MIIDSRNYSGMCNCGHVHNMETEFCIIEKGCLASVGKYLDKYGLSGYCCTVYDDNTYNIEGLARPRADKEIVLPASGLHANEHGVELLMKELPYECGYLIAIGSGTIHDITRYCAYLKKIPFVSCPTAASVDGFCSSVAAMTWNGCKKTLTAVSPKIVVADLDIISKAPMRLTRSGFGDMIGKYIALCDWRVGNALTGEYFCRRIHDMTLDATKAVVGSAEGIKNGDVTAYEKLTYGLLISGLAMQLLGNSRCASGAEHHISHIIEMSPEGLGVSSDALHGEKVGVGTLMACREYHKLASLEGIGFTDYPVLTRGGITDIFGKDMAESIMDENRADCAKGITGKLLSEKWDEICGIVSSVPAAEELREMYSVLGVKAELADIGVENDKCERLLECSPLVRNRVTLMRLRRAMMF